MPEKRSPVPPARLWGLWNEGGDDDGLGCWLQHELADSGEEGPIVFASEASAIRAAKGEMRLLMHKFNDRTVIRPVLIGMSPRVIDTKEFRTKLPPKGTPRPKKED